MSEIQYQAIIEDGKIKSEEGYFFKAGSFEVKSKNSTFLCKFNRLDNGEVVWQVLENSDTIFKLTHPDYVPETTPGKNVEVDSLETGQLVIFDALGRLDISKDKDYKLFFDENKTTDYEIVQYKS